MNRPSKYEIILSIFVAYEKLDDINDRGCLIDIALDVAGMPRDNTLETGACDYANGNDGRWPVWGFCRDSAHEAIIEQDGNVSRQASTAVYLDEKSQVVTA